MKRIINKKTKKLIDKSCYFCKEDNYVLLDVHRIIPGEDGGKYTDHNSLCVCANCHRRCHAGEIKIDRKYFSSSGKWILHYWIDNQEFWQ